jgi:hypothetical protein
MGLSKIQQSVFYRILDFISNLDNNVCNPVTAPAGSNLNDHLLADHSAQSSACERSPPARSVGIAIMSERTFRIILGSALLLLLFLQQQMLIYAYIGLLIFEGMTNWRIPILVSKIRYSESRDVTSPECQRFNFEAERMLRLVVASLLIISFVMFNDQLWIFPWFIGFMLFMAGLTNICPMAMVLRWSGFR